MRISRRQARELGIPWPAAEKPQPRGMNATEARFAALADLWYREGRLVESAYEPVKFRLADRTYYTPDFELVLLAGPFFPLVLYVEVKVRDKSGRVLWRDDAAVKAKAVAERFPHPFYLAIWSPTLRRWDFKLLPSRRWGQLWSMIIKPWDDELC